MKTNFQKLPLRDGVGIPEFLDWKWVEIDQLIDVVVDFKRDVYKKVTSEIKKVVTN